MQIYETQLNELSSQNMALSKDVGTKDELLQEARDTINLKVWRSTRYFPFFATNRFSHLFAREPCYHNATRQREYFRILQD